MTTRLLSAAFEGNPYAGEIEAVLPRLLALADMDPLSPTRGFGDRQYWGWKLIDFANGTFQGAANGLARMLELDALGPSLSRDAITARIADMFAATRRMTRRDGSLEEAFPYERSYCVTALVGFDLQRALDAPGVRGAVGGDADETIARLIRFLVRADETHGLISNHLATAAAALFRWHKATGDAAALAKARVLLDRILDNQSTEGWFSEYGGADPGYQTLCMGHLADIADTHPSDRLEEALGRSLAFLGNFAHPDGSFGGLYGSRSTRIYYPGGIEALARRFPAAAALAGHMRPSIAEHRTVPLRAIDQPNLIPLFNSYCQALAAPVSDMAKHDALPIHAGPVSRSFPQAGLVVDGRAGAFTVISTRKGGVVQRWTAGLSTIDAGLVVADERGALYTSQTDDVANEVDATPDRVVVRGQLRRLRHPLPGAIGFAGLRILAASVLRIPALGALLKKLLVRYLIAGKRQSGGGFTRTITLAPEFSVTDKWERQALRRVSTARPFSVIHMASQGYWQAQDDAPSGPAETP